MLSVSGSIRVLVLVSMSKKVIMVDPPSGWQYGFPAPLDDSMTFQEQLARHKYPVEDYELAENYSRYWEEEMDD